MSELSGEWKKVLEPEFKKPYYKDLYNFVRQEYATHIIYPPADKLFEALHLTPLSEIKVVILGQDPYHGENQAHGLSFSVPPSQRRIPPSLVNIYKELADDIGTYIPNNGNLVKWSKQGVLMLNSGRDINNRITINETPDQPQFQNLQHEKLRASHLHAPLLKAALMADVPVWLYGEAGSGKSTAA